jgi:hypothetical protein
MFDHWEVSSSYQIWRVSSGTFTSIASKAGNLTPGDIMTLAVSKGTLTAFVNSASEVSAVDSSYLAGMFGMQGPLASTEAWDDWHGGNLAVSSEGGGGEGLTWADDFNRANEDPAAGWTALVGQYNFKVASYMCRANSTAAFAAAYYNAASATADHYSSVKVHSLYAGGGPCVRVSTSGRTFYMFDHWEGNNSYNIWRVNSRVFSMVASIAGGPSEGDIMTLTVSKGTLTGFVNSSFLVSGVDSSYLTGMFGAQIPGAVGGIGVIDTLDDWHGGNL